MSTLKLLDDYIKQRISDLEIYPEIIKMGMDTIAGEVPHNLKLAIVLAELTTFASHLRKPIELYDGTLVPTNSIVFALSGSGDGKDKMLNAVRKSLSGAYNKLEEARKDYAKQDAIKKAKLEGADKADWHQFYSAPMSLQVGLGTVEGLLQHFSDLSQNPLGAGSILSTEIGQELQTNGSIIDVMKNVSIGYDLGNIKPQVLKSKDNQTKEIIGLPINALLFGSQDGILFNNDVKNKFKNLFTTQFARRCNFSFTPELPTPLHITSTDQVYEYRKEERERVITAQHTLNSLTDSLVEATNQTPLKLTENTDKLFDIYLEYNNIKSLELSSKYPMSKLSRKHKQWLALKLAGVYAILNEDLEINESTYAQAIRTVEFLANDLIKFETELVKESYEQLSNLCHFHEEDGEYKISLHELRKMGYVTGTGNPKTKLQDLVTLLSSYDQLGRYTLDDNNVITFTKTVLTDIVGFSAIVFDSDLKGKELKNHMAVNCAEGFDFFESDFEGFGSLLKENSAYTSFQFKNGKRSKANIIGGTKAVVLDIDESYIKDEEVHLLLGEFNHFIARTSDPDNAYKFRVIIELDAIVDVPDNVWKQFIEVVAEEFGLTVDNLPKSQIYFSFEGREILYQLKGEKLNTKVLLDVAESRIRSKPTPVTKIPSNQKKQLLDDPLETFAFAFNAENGERSRLMYRALAYAGDLGADKEYLTTLAYELNDYWQEPIELDRLEKTLLQPALRRL